MPRKLFWNTAETELWAGTDFMLDLFCIFVALWVVGIWACVREERRGGGNNQQQQKSSSLWKVQKYLCTHYKWFAPGHQTLGDWAGSVKWSVTLFLKSQCMFSILILYPWVTEKFLGLLWGEQQFTTVWKVFGKAIGTACLTEAQDFVGIPQKQIQVSGNSLIYILQNNAELYFFCQYAGIFPVPIRFRLRLLLRLFSCCEICILRLNECHLVFLTHEKNHLSVLLVFFPFLFWNDKFWQFTSRLVRTLTGSRGVKNHFQISWPLAQHRGCLWCAGNCFQPLYYSHFPPDCSLACVRWMFVLVGSPFFLSGDKNKLWLWSLGLLPISTVSW